MDEPYVLNCGFDCAQRKNNLGEIEYFIKVHETDQRIKEVAVTAFHPYKTNLFWSFFYSLYEFFWEVKAIEVRIENQAQPMFVKVDQIAVALGIPKRDFLKIYYSCGSKKDITLCLSLMKQMDFPVTKYKECLGLLKRIEPQFLIDLFKYVEKSPFRKQVLEALVKFGEYPSVNQHFKNKEKTFSYSINAQAIEFKFIVGDRIDLFELTSRGKKTLGKKPQINPKIATAAPSIVSPNQRTAMTKVKEAAANFFFGPETVEVPRPLADLYAKHQLDAKQLNRVLKVIYYKNLVQLADTIFKDEQKKFLRTLLKINACMEENAGILNTLFGNNLKYEIQDENHFEFAVNEDTAIVGGKKFAEGSFKEALTAYVLNTMQKVVELKIEGRTCNDNIELTLEEKKLLDKIAKNNPYMIPPYECVINDKQKKKLIMFQPFFDGNGSQLSKASPWQLCMAIREAALGLSLMHADGYVHSDVKPENLFFNGQLENDAPIDVKVADIGMAQRNGGKLRGGTFVYLPPEVVSRNGIKYQFQAYAKAEPKVDSYSLGVTLFELLNGYKGDMKVPLAVMTEKELTAKINDIQNRVQKESRYFEYERKLMLKLVNLTRRLLAYNKADRMDCAAVAKKLAFVA